MSETVFQVNNLYVGRVDAAKYGYSRGTLRVTIDIEIRRQPGARRTTEHARITDPLEFAMMGAVWNQRETDHVSGGQNLEVLSELVTFADDFDADKAARLVELWQRWHLNAMKAGCAHQEPVYKTEYGRQVPDLDNTPLCPLWTCKVCGGLLDVVDDGGSGYSVHRDERDSTHTVERTQYRYGSAWLTEPLPDDFEAQLRALLPDQNTPEEDEDAPSLAALMKRDGIKASATPAAHRLDERHPDGTRWRVSFRRPGADGSFGVTFHLGSAHGNRKPAALEVLSCVLDDASAFRNARHAADLAADFGMEDDEAEKLYRKLEGQEASLRRFLGDKYDEYAELN